MTRQSIVISVVELQKATPAFELTGIVNNECTFHINGFQIDTDGRWFHSVGGERESTTVSRWWRAESLTHFHSGMLFWIVLLSAVSHASLGNLNVNDYQDYSIDQSVSKHIIRYGRPTDPEKRANVTLI